MILILLQCILATCQEFSSNDNIIVGNVKRRNQIPLYQISRRFSENLNYRKTKDIRDRLDRKTDEMKTNRDEIVFDREINDVIYEKKDDFNRKKEDNFDRKRNEIQDTKRKMEIDKGREYYDRQREEVWNKSNKRDGSFDRNKEMTDRQRDAIDRKIDEMWDRRFEQSEREAHRLDETNDKLDSLHRELQWLTLNTDEGIGIGI